MEVVPAGVSPILAHASQRVERLGVVAGVDVVARRRHLVALAGGLTGPLLLGVALPLLKEIRERAAVIPAVLRVPAAAVLAALAGSLLVGRPRVAPVGARPALLRIEDLLIGLLDLLELFLRGLGIVGIGVRVILFAHLAVSALYGGFIRVFIYAQDPVRISDHDLSPSALASRLAQIARYFVQTPL